MKKAKPEVFLDHYLSSIGLWRKPIARDGHSLFRAVSEQVSVVIFFFLLVNKCCLQINANFYYNV